MLMSHIPITQLQQYLTYCQSNYMYTLPLKYMLEYLKANSIYTLFHCKYSDMTFD